MKRISMTYGQVLFELGIKKESLQKAQDMLHENEGTFKGIRESNDHKERKRKCGGKVVF